LAVIALKLKEVFELNDINELPIVYNIAWYEQKAVIVLLALLYLGSEEYSPWANITCISFAGCSQLFSE
jgi:hydroxylamine reductase (hybrid-cluster protein)